MNSRESQDIELACQRLCTQFHIFVDGYRHDEIVELFTDNAQWIHMTGRFSGKADIRAYLDSKSTYPLVRHLVSNILIIPLDETHAEGICYVTVFYALPDTTPALLRAPIVLVTYRDKFERTDAGWKFSERHPEINFEAPEFATMINTKEQERRLLG